MTGFLRFLAADTPFSQARVAILGVPLERTVSFRGGPAQAPTAIRAVSDSVESYSALFRCDLAQVGVCDLGDVDTHGPLLKVLENAEAEVGRILRADKAPVVLGGEHTVALPAVRAAACRGPVQVVALDAHSDLRDAYLGEQICHATVLRRVSEVATRLVIVGTRSFFGGEADEPFFARPDEIGVRLDPKLPVWLTLDLDALDPSLCPGVTNPEPGGLSYHEVIAIWRELSRFRVMGMDLVELAPPFDPSGVSAVCAAKLVLEAICAFWGTKSRSVR
ncbi:agmatinase [Candidatus Bipolaricaulota bacterium]|nr:agmatinase [Candidatus Bipolaricaulota bacterium]